MASPHFHLFLVFTIGILLLVSVLNNAPEDVEDNVSTEVCIVEGVNIIESAMLNHFLDGEWIGVVSSDETHTIHGDERAENGSALDDYVVVEEVCEASHDKRACDNEAPVGGC